MQTSCQLPELVFEIRAIWPPSKDKNHIENVRTIKKKKFKCMSTNGTINLINCMSKLTHYPGCQQMECDQSWTVHSLPNWGNHK